MQHWSIWRLSSGDPAVDPSGTSHSLVLACAPCCVLRVEDHLYLLGNQDVNCPSIGQDSGLYVTLFSVTCTGLHVTGMIILPHGTRLLTWLLKHYTRVICVIILHIY